MRLLTVIFPSPTPLSDYPRLLSVLRESAAIRSPRTPLTVVEAEGDPTLASSHPAASARAAESFGANTRKMQLWQEAVEELPDGEVLALLDCDTMILRDLSDAEALNFDVTYTSRPFGSRFPINSGVVLARGSERTRRFFRRWREVNELMLDCPGLHEEYRRTWGGINQAALGAMIHDPRGVRLLQTHCAEWNCEDTSWSLYRPGLTRIAHVKGRLRMVCLEGRPAEPRLADLEGLWRGFEARAMAAAA